MELQPNSVEFRNGRLADNEVSRRVAIILTRGDEADSNLGEQDPSLLCVGVQFGSESGENVATGMTMA